MKNDHLPGPPPSNAMPKKVRPYFHTSMRPYNGTPVRPQALTPMRFFFNSSAQITSLWRQEHCPDITLRQRLSKPSHALVLIRHRIQPVRFSSEVAMRWACASTPGLRPVLIRYPKNTCHYASNHIPQGAFRHRKTNQQT